jgi:transcriptional regulator with PAS, ATPase and Fis domain
MSPTILLYATDDATRTALYEPLRVAGVSVRASATPAQLLSDLARGDAEAILFGVMPETVLRKHLLSFSRLRARFPWIQLVTCSRDTTPPPPLLRSFCHLTLPVDAARLIRGVRNAIHQSHKEHLRHQSQAHLAAVMRSIKDGMLAVDKELHLTSFNAAAATFCALTPGHLQRPFGAKELGCSGQCVNLLREAIQRTETVERPHVECRLPGGSARIFDLTASPLYSAAGSAAGAVMVIRDETRLNTLERNLGERRVLHRMTGSSHQLQTIFDLVERLADVTTTVLITGESGTGKELIADALHHTGKRRGGPMIKFNCAAVSENLLESELFGHVRGAFTGANHDRAGRFELAHGGTIFLDEIGDISPRMQLRLLRVLQEHSLERVGSAHTIPVDVRVVAATNADLEARIRAGTFRADLFYRIKVATIHIPPLRERRIDIPLLTEHFLQQFNRRHQRAIVGLTAEAEALLMRYAWPGNVRELENVLEYAYILCRGQLIGSEHLPPELTSSPATPPSPEYQAGNREELHDALIRTGGNKSKAARLLGISRRTFYRHLNDETQADN